MRDIREGLAMYEGQVIMLKQFRNSVENRHALYRVTFKNEMDNPDSLINTNHFDWYEFENHSFSNNSVILSEVVEILNALDLPIASLEVKDGQDELAKEIYQYCDYMDLWGVLCERSDFEFLMAMVYISQLESRQGNLKELKNIVKSALKEKGFKILNFKPSVFIAMSFDKDLKDVRESISKVIKDEGLIPLLIDSKEHNNQIVPEIFNEIDKAKFVIADLTHHKTGVYYEAGYAKGKGKEVIFTCRKDDFEKRHFDVAQTNTIVWETTTELGERLTKRIESMTLVEV